MLACYRYIELNPVRAAMVARPRDYLWTSYRANAEGERVTPWLTPHPLYCAFWEDALTRRAANRAMFRQELDTGLVGEILSATNGDCVLGTSRFQEEMARVLGRRVSAGKSGRPRKNLDPAIKEDLFE